MAATAFIDEYGIHLPDYPEVLEDLKDAFRSIYGDDLYLEADSQEGELCAIFALRIHDCHTLAASIYNAYSPLTAQGTGLSSVVKTNGIRRASASHSQADVRLVGQAGTVISGGIVRDQSGKRWLLPEKVTIPLEGETLVTATAEEIGDIRAAVNEISRIETPVRGWQEVYNPEAAVVGSPVETDGQLRERQRISTALPSLSIFDGTKGAVASLSGVIRSRAYENDSDSYDDNGLPPHHICFVVEGGDAQTIAETISLKKGPGCGTHGDITLETRDKYGSPSSISFYRPEIDQIGVFIRIKPLDGYLVTTGETIRDNVATYIGSHPIGESILLSKLYSPINSAEPDPSRRTFDVLELRIGPKGQELVSSNMEILFNHAASCEINDVTLQDY